MKDIKTEDLVKLKELKMSDKEISEYYKQKGISIATSSVTLRLIKYYKSIGQEKPKVSRGKQIFIEIDIEELVMLRELGLSIREMVKYYESQGIKVSAGTLNLKFKEYYKQKGMQISQNTSYQGITTAEELLKLKQQGLSPEQISKYFEERKLEVDLDKLKIINQDVKQEESQQNSRRIGIENEQLAKLKEQDLSDKQISEYLKKQGIIIAPVTVNKRLSEYYKTMDKEMSNELLKEALFNGLTIKEVTNNEKNKIRIVLNRLKRLRFIVENAKKIGDRFVPDQDFLEVIKRLENIDISDNNNRFKLYVKPYVSGNGVCERGNIDLIRDKVFKRNKDLMVYVLSGMDITYSQQYDKKIWDAHRRTYLEKIDKYFTRLNDMEKTQEKKVKEQKTKADEKER